MEKSSHKREGTKREGRREREEIKRRKGERKRERKKNRLFFLLSPAFRWSELVRPRSKVNLLDEGYASRGRDSSYLVYFHPKGCLAVFWDC